MIAIRIDIILGVIVRIELDPHTVADATITHPTAGNPFSGRMGLDGENHPVSAPSGTIR